MDKESVALGGGIPSLLSGFLLASGMLGVFPNGAHASQSIQMHAPARFKPSPEALLAQHEMQVHKLFDQIQRSNESLLRLSERPNPAIETSPERIERRLRELDCGLKVKPLLPEEK